MPVCAVCRQPADLKCARCLKVHYCARDHQRLHWSCHKDTCKRPISREEFIRDAITKIAGNIHIMRAWYAGEIVINIPETVEEFVRGDSLHFAHLSMRESDTAEVVLRDYTQEISLAHIDYDEIKKSNPKPPSEWTVMFRD
jgi:hypothetical protein